MVEDAEDVVDVVDAEAKVISYPDPTCVLDMCLGVGGLSKRLRLNRMFQATNAGLAE